MGDSPQPTQEQIDELRAEIGELREHNAALREQVEAIEGALNALVVVYGVRRLPPPGDGDT